MVMQKLDLRDLVRFLTQVLHLLMIVQLLVALFTNLIAQQHLQTQATYGLIQLLKSWAQEISLQVTTTTFAWDAHREAPRRQWTILGTSCPQVSTAQTLYHTVDQCL